ncbi:protein kinase domain-containing protein [Sinimarinibacterium flocculans]|uniref:protein kinase domain-containing protein n=1 Tax=Sinimarinibacterium flocculans TaxID=985250 RepID=UPI0035150B7E
MDVSAARAHFIYRFGGIEFDTQRNELKRDGQPVSIEPKPLAVLAQLLLHAGEVVTKAELIESVWGGRPISEQVVPNAFAKLRRALGAAHATRIVTVSRYGYRFEGSLERAALGRAAVSELQLHVGNAMPDRPHWELAELLGSSAGSEAWLIRHRKTGEHRVCKFCSSGDDLYALRRELTICRLLAAMLGDRDDLVRLIDWQLDREPFYLEFAYGGEDLLRWWQNADRLRELPLEARLDLFLQIADAVSSAHDVGVLHKDLKPSNVLIRRDAKGGWCVQLTDFGSSRLLDPGRIEALGITHLDAASIDTGGAGSHSGTLMYMAPEHFDGKSPTTRSDVYALGVILYQLICGNLRRPLAPGWELEIEDVLLREDIALATAGDPQHRLASVAEFSHRLRTRAARHAERQAREAVQARALAAERALERDRARRPWRISALATLAAGLIISVTLLVDASKARQAAEHEALRATALNDFLVDDIIGSGKIHDQGYEKDPTLRDVLLRASTAVAGRFADQPLIDASVSMTLADALMALDDKEQAAMFYQRAATRYQEHPDRPRLPLAITQYRLVEALVDRGSYEEARGVLQRADELAADLRSEDGALEIAAASAHSTFEYQQLNVAAALNHFRALQALALRHEPEDTWLAFHTSDGIAQCLYRLGHHDEAERHFRAILSDPRFVPENIGSATALVKVSLGAVLKASGRAREALPLVVEGQSEMEAANGPDDYNVITALGHVGGVHAALAQHEQALAIYGEVHERLQRRFGEHHQLTLMQLVNVGISHLNLGHSAQAVSSLQRAEAGLGEQYGDDNAMVQSARYYLSLALSDTNELEQALALLDKTQATRLRTATGGRAWTAKLDALRGKVLIRMGAVEEGLQLLVPAIERLERDESARPETIRQYRALVEQYRVAHLGNA